MRACAACSPLMRADEDFREPIQNCLANGFDVQLVTHDTGSAALIGQPYPRPPLLWSTLLRQAAGGQPVVMAYGGEGRRNAALHSRRITCHC